MGPIELAAATYLKEPTQVTRSALEAALVARISQSHRYVVVVLLAFLSVLRMGELTRASSCLRIQDLPICAPSAG